MAITQVSNSLVKQDLTISGGTVDNTVIGSGTPAAGTFTTVAGTLASTVTGTTAAASDNSTKIATTAYVTTALANLVDSAPGTLNTLNELAAALGDDAAFSTTVTNSIATKLPLAGGTLTGDLRINGTLGIGAAASSVIGVYSTKSLANGLAAQFTNSESSTGSGLVVDGGNNASTYSADFRDYNANSLMRITGAGNVGIGTATPGALLDVHSSSGDSNLYISTGNTSANTSLFFNDGANAGRVGYDHANNQLRFFANGAEVFRMFQLAGAYGVIQAHGSGSATYPNYTFSGDTNTGMYRSAADALSFSTGGSERMRITARGSIGIGVTPRTDTHSSWGQLFIGEKGSLISEIPGSSGLYGTLLSDNLYVDADTGAFANITTDESSLYSQEAGVHKFFSQGSGTAGAAVTLSEKMRIAAGKVSIGTTAVGSATSASLHVADPGVDVQAIFGDNLASIDDPQIRVIGRDSANSAIRYLFTGLDADANHGFIGYNAGAGAFVNALSFNTSGNVGIGTTTPNARLDTQLAGNGGLPVSSGTTQTYGSFRVGATNFNTILDMGTAGATGAWLQASDRTGLGTNYSILLNPNGGNVGINETGPFGKLHISDTQTGRTAADGVGSLLVLEDDENGMSILSSNSGAGYILFGDAADAAAGGIAYDHSADRMRFRVNAAWDKLVIGSNGYLIAQSASQVRLVLGSQGNSSNNTSNWIRGSGTEVDINTGGGDFNLEVAGNKKLTVSASTGQVEAVAGNFKVASGYGLNFAATADGTTATSELLDDYEEGTFTPAFNGNPGGNGYHGATGGSYVKVGRKVSFNIYIAMSSWFSNTTHLVISGLPFASGTATSGSDVLYGGAYPSYIANMEGSSTIDMGHIGSQSTFIGLYTHTGGSITNVTGSGHANNFAIIVNGHYFTN